MCRSGFRKSEKLKEATLGGVVMSLASHKANVKKPSQAPNPHFFSRIKLFGLTPNL